MINKISNPLVTVYITNHNYEKYLEKSILSALNQTYQNFEIIIIDDGSTDNSKKKIEKFSKNKKVKIIYQKNKGLVISNNIAIKASQGKYITRLDADDWLHPNFLQIMIDEAEKNKNCAMIFCDYFIVNQKGQVIDQFYRHEVKKMKLKNQPAHGACSLLNVKVLKEIGGYDEQFSCQDGVDLWLSLIKRYKVKNVNLPLFYYRQHEKSLTKNKIKIFNTRNRILKKHAIKKNRKKKIIAIIPVRGQGYNETLVALKKLNNKPIIHNLIEELDKIGEIKKIIISTPDLSIIKNVKKKYSNKRGIYIDKRANKLAQMNTSVENTIKTVIKKYSSTSFQPDLALIVNVVCPFLDVSSFEAAINLSKIFETDEVMAVRKEFDNFYTHSGGGLKPIHNNKNLSMERNEVYREIGGLRIINTSKVGKTNNSIGHILLDEKSSFQIKSEEDLLIAKYISTKKI
mgnify:CR=1 FL=1